MARHCTLTAKISVRPPNAVRKMVYNISMTTFHGGKLPPDPSKPRLKIGRYFTAAPTYPKTVDYLSKVTSWPMYLNDSIGDCTCATTGHIIQAFSTYGQGKTITVSDDDVLSAYEAVSGYNPRTGANDNGAYVQDVLNYWRKNGVGGHKNLAFAAVDFKNKDEVRKATEIFGGVYLGIDFPDTAMDQFDAGKPWDVVAGAKSEGGHAINLGFYDVDTNTYKVVTWGRVQEMTQAFFDKYVDECWVVITPEWLNEQGLTPTGIDLYSLGQDFATLTGEKNPFPQPVVPPAPTPEPSPEPTPQPTPQPAPPSPSDDGLLKFFEFVFDELRKFFKSL